MSQKAPSEVVKLLSNLNQLLNNTQDEYSAIPFFTTSSPMASSIAEAIRKKKEEAQAQAALDAADEIIELQKKAVNLIETKRQALALIRKDEAAAKQKIITVAIAKLYGEKTMNWLPLAIELGMLKVTASQALANPDFTIPPLIAEQLLAEVQQMQAAKVAAKKTATK